MKCLVLFMGERRTKHRGAQERRTSSRIRVSVVRLFLEKCRQRFGSRRGCMYQRGVGNA